MKRTLFAASAIALVLGANAAQASSHREAPAIAGLPRLDGTDFYMFRSYEPGRADYVTMIANYIPLQTNYGGPNFFALDNKAVYDINIDNRGEGRPSMRFRFRFTDTNRNIALNIGGDSVKVPFINVGAITATNNSNQNVLETYTLSLVSGDGKTETPITGPGGTTVFARPIDDVGARSIQNYPAYAQSFIFPITIPGCAAPGRVFVGQRADGFVANLGETFDLLNYTHPIGEQYNNFAQNSLDDDNVTSLAIEAPINCLTAGKDPVIGGWTTSSQVLHNGELQQVSRLGNPLVNELVIGVADKDKFNATMPAKDLGNFATYVTNPTLPAVIAGFVGGTPPALPRNDLVAVFVTGIPGVNAPLHPLKAAPGEEMRLNTSIAPVAIGKQGRLGVIGDTAANIPMDLAGYPNGRRPGDDVVDISLRVVMGKVCQLNIACTPADAPSGNVEYTDGAYVDSTMFANAFPYLNPPSASSPQVAPSAGGVKLAR